MYSVILGELDISPKEKSNRNKSTKNPFWVEKHNPMATEAIRIPAVITLKGLYRITIAETTICSRMIKPASAFTISSAGIVPSGVPNLAASQGQEEFRKL